MSALSCWVTCGIVFQASPQMFGRLAPYPAHGDALDFSPLGEIRQGWFGEPHSASCCTAMQRMQYLCKGFNVIFTDAPAGAGAFHVMNVHAQLPRQPPRMRSSRDRIAMLRASGLAQLRGHAKSSAAACLG